MKKATLSIALFSLVVLTSFTTVQDTGNAGGTGGSGGNSNDTQVGSGQNLGGGKKLDRTSAPVLPAKLDYSNSQAQNLQFRKKSDI